MNNCIVKKGFPPVILLLFILQSGFAQKDSTRQKIYQIKPIWQLPASLTCIGLSNLGFRNLDKVSRMTEAEVAALNPNNINAFDRPSAFLNPADFASYQKRSDLFLNVSLFTPLVLGLDKKIRKDWLDLITLYLMTHAVDNALYFTATYSVRRPRPLTYNTGLSLAERSGDSKSNSFFSGHTSFSAAATFFAARVYTDYHHIKGWKRVLIFTGAAIPPSLVGYYRYRAGKHFKSDVITGLAAGAASGIFVPYLFKKSKQSNSITLAPYTTGSASGLTAFIHL